MQDGLDEGFPEGLYRTGDGHDGGEERWNALASGSECSLESLRRTGRLVSLDFQTRKAGTLAAPERRADGLEIRHRDFAGIRG